MTVVTLLHERVSRGSEWTKFYVTSEVHNIQKRIIFKSTSFASLEMLHNRSEATPSKTTVMNSLNYYSDERLESEDHRWWQA
eukprot:3770013-Amphidinium_carterae.1